MQFLPGRKKNSSIRGVLGFTLIELLVVISIIGLLSSVVLASLSGARTKARDAKRMSDLSEIQKALELYYATNNAYPVSVAFSVWNATTWGNGSPSNLYSGLVGGGYIATLPADPINKEGGAGNFLGDNAPTDQGYAYDSPDGQSYVIGTNLEKGGTASDCGNYEIHGGANPGMACPL